VSFLNALWIVPILGILIFLHELGHFVMARRAGVRVEEFGFGLPPRIWGTKRGDTIYSINALPVGGFVRVLGEDGKSMAPDSMQAKTAGQRAKFLAAGSFMNFLTAIVLMGVMVAFQGNSSENVYVSEVADQSPAQTAGWQPGDRFVSVAGHTIDSGSEVGKITANRAGEETQVVLERNGENFTTTIVPRTDPPAGQGATGIVLSGSPVSTVKVTGVPADSVAEQIGMQDGDVLRSVDGQPINDYLQYSLYLRNHTGQQVALDVTRDGQPVTLTFTVPTTLPDSTEPLGADLLQDVKFTKVPLTQVPSETVRTFATTIQRMGEGLISLVRGQTPLGDIAGPIGMGQLTSEVITQSGMPLWVTLANLMVILSLNLGILNLLPLPALDGGRLFFVLLEVLRGGKRVPPEKEGVVHFVGLLVLLTAMFLIAFVDINRIISGTSFLE
jgi:regulator of sigma E protease